MKRNRAFRRFAAVFLALFCMAATSTVAFAGGGDGEPYYTGEETTGGYEPQPMTPEGNIEAGVLFLSDYLTAYGDPEMAVMAYNCGPGGAQKLWAAGTYHTEHSQKVMARFDYWTSVLEG